MKTYIVQIIYKIKTIPKGVEQYDEQWRVIFAEDEREAISKARKIALDEEDHFLDRHGRPVSWELIGIKDLQPFEVKHGSLVCSSVKEVMPISGPLWETHQP